MLRHAVHLLQRAIMAFKNPYLSLRGKLAYTIERPWRWTRASLKRGWYVEFETEEERSTFDDVFFREAYRPLPCDGAIVIDVGAHRGFYALYALLNGARKVIALECEPNNVSSLQRMIAANHLSEAIRLVPKAAWSGRGTIQLSVGTENWAHSVTRPGFGHRKLDVPTTTLVEVLENEPDDAAVVVKSNCEGAETEVFKLVPSAVSMMMIQYHSWATESLDVFRVHLLSQGFVTEVRSRNQEHANLLCWRERSS